MSNAYGTLVDLAVLIKHEGSDTPRVQDLLVQLGREIERWAMREENINTDHDDATIDAQLEHVDQMERIDVVALLRLMRKRVSDIKLEIKSKSRHIESLANRRKAIGQSVIRVSSRLSVLKEEQGSLSEAENPDPPVDTRRKGPICPVCSRKSRLKRGRSISAHLDPDAWFWACSPRCDTRVGCHPGTQTALGSLAGEVTRCARKSAHNELDALIAEGAFTNRSAAYAWLASMMDQSEQDAHIGMYGLSECNRVMALCRQYRAAMAVTERRALIEEQGR